MSDNRGANFKEQSGAQPTPVEDNGSSSTGSSRSAPAEAATGQHNELETVASKTSHNETLGRPTSKMKEALVSEASNKYAAHQARPMLADQRDLVEFDEEEGDDWDAEEEEAAAESGQQQVAPNVDALSRRASSSARPGQLLAELASSVGESGKALQEELRRKLRKDSTRAKEQLLQFGKFGSHLRKRRKRRRRRGKEEETHVAEKRQRQLSLANDNPRAVAQMAAGQPTQSLVSAIKKDLQVPLQKLLLSKLSPKLNHNNNAVQETNGQSAPLFPAHLLGAPYGMPSASGERLLASVVAAQQRQRPWNALADDADLNGQDGRPQALATSGHFYAAQQPPPTGDKLIPIEIIGLDPATTDSILFPDGPQQSGRLQRRPNAGLNSHFVAANHQQEASASQADESASPEGPYTNATLEQQQQTQTSGRPSSVFHVHHFHHTTTPSTGGHVAASAEEQQRQQEAAGQSSEPADAETVRTSGPQQQRQVFVNEMGELVYAAAGSGQQARTNGTAREARKPPEAQEAQEGGEQEDGNWETQASGEDQTGEQAAAGGRGDANEQQQHWQATGAASADAQQQDNPIVGSEGSHEDGGDHDQLAGEPHEQRDNLRGKAQRVAAVGGDGQQQRHWIKNGTLLAKQQDGRSLGQSELTSGANSTTASIAHNNNGRPILATATSAAASTETNGADHKKQRATSANRRRQQQQRLFVANAGQTISLVEGQSGGDSVTTSVIRGGSGPTQRQQATISGDLSSANEADHGQSNNFLMVSYRPTGTSSGQGRLSAALQPAAMQQHHHQATAVAFNDDSHLGGLNQFYAPAHTRWPNNRAAHNHRHSPATSSMMLRQIQVAPLSFAGAANANSYDEQSESKRLYNSVNLDPWRHFGSNISSASQLPYPPAAAHLAASVSPSMLGHLHYSASNGQLEQGGEPVWSNDDEKLLASYLTASRQHSHRAEIAPNQMVSAFAPHPNHQAPSTGLQNGSHNLADELELLKQLQHQQQRPQQQQQSSLLVAPLQQQGPPLSARNFSSHEEAGDFNVVPATHLRLHQQTSGRHPRPIAAPALNATSPPATTAPSRFELTMASDRLASKLAGKNQTRPGANFEFVPTSGGADQSPASHSPSGHNGKVAPSLKGNSSNHKQQSHFDSGTVDFAPDSADGLGNLALAFIFVVSLLTFVLIAVSLIYRKRRAANLSTGSTSGRSGGVSGGATANCAAPAATGKKKLSLTQRTRNFVRGNFHVHSSRVAATGQQCQGVAGTQAKGFARSSGPSAVSRGPNLGPNLGPGQACMKATKRLACEPGDNEQQPTWNGKSLLSAFANAPTERYLNVHSDSTTDSADIRTLNTRLHRNHPLAKMVDNGKQARLTKAQQVSDNCKWHKIDSSSNNVVANRVEVGPREPTNFKPCDKQAQPNCEPKHPRGELKRRYVNLGATFERRAPAQQEARHKTKGRAAQHSAIGEVDNDDEDESERKSRVARL